MSFLRCEQAHDAHLTLAEVRRGHSILIVQDTEAGKQLQQLVGFKDHAAADTGVSGRVVVESSGRQAL